MKTIVKKVKNKKAPVISISISVSIVAILYVVMHFGGNNSETINEGESVAEMSVSTSEVITNKAFKSDTDKIISQEKSDKGNFNSYLDYEYVKKDNINDDKYSKTKLLSNVSIEEFMLELDGRGKQIQDSTGKRSNEVVEYTADESKSINNNQIAIIMASPDEIYEYLNIIKPIANRTNNPILFGFMGNGFFKLHKEFKEINQGESNNYLDDSELYFKNVLYFSQDLRLSNNACAYLSNIYAERHRIMPKEDYTDKEIEILSQIIAYGNISLGDGGVDISLQSIPKYNIAYSYYHLYMITDDSNILLKEYFYNQSKDKYNEIDLNSSYFIQAQNDLINLENAHNQTIYH